MRLAGIAASSSTTPTMAAPSNAVDQSKPALEARCVAGSTAGTTTGVVRVAGLGR